LVRQLETAAILSTERKNGETEMDRLKKIENILQSTTSNSNAIEENLIEDIDENDSDEVEDVILEDDENDDAPLVIENIKQKSDIDTATIAALKQYHRIFDDEQIDYDLIYELLKYVFKSEFLGDGSILVFLPGWDDISRMSKLLLSSHEFGKPNIKIVQLHSGIPKNEQNLVFQKLKKGEHKIILRFI
jgi:HrpA-like RNA helicase